MQARPPSATVEPMIGLGHISSVGTATLASLTASAGPRRRVRLLDHHLLLLVTAGQGSHDVDFTRHACRPGTVLWARPGQVIGYGHQPGLDAIAVTWPVGFLPELPGVPWPPGDAFAPVCWQLAGEDEDAVIDEVSQLVVDCERHGDRSVGVDLLRHQLAVLVLRLATVPAVDPYPPGGAEAETFLRFRREVEVDYARCRQVAVYAERLGCSVRTLTRACLAATGRSAKQVIDDRVVLEAKRLLAATDLSVIAISRRLGFVEQTHFCRLFHRTAGLPPGAFRSMADPERAARAGVPTQTSAAPPTTAPGVPAQSSVPAQPGIVAQSGVPAQTGGRSRPDGYQTFRGRASVPTRPLKSSTMD